MRCWEEILPWECGETLEQHSLRSCGCSICASAQGQVGWALSSLVEWKVALSMTQEL